MLRVVIQMCHGKHHLAPCYRVWLPLYCPTKLTAPTGIFTHGKADLLPILRVKFAVERHNSSRLVLADFRVEKQVKQDLCVQAQQETWILVHFHTIR